MINYSGGSKANFSYSRKGKTSFGALGKAFNSFRKGQRRALKLQRRASISALFRGGSAFKM